MKILSASVKVIDDKNHVRILTLEEVDITIKGAKPNPIEHIPVIIEAPEQNKKSDKKKNKKQ
jgi:hypothetical protein